MKCKMYDSHLLDHCFSEGIVKVDEAEVAGTISAAGAGIVIATAETGTVEVVATNKKLLFLFLLPNVVSSLEKVFIATLIITSIPFQRLF